MNVVLNVEEVYAVLARVTGMIVDEGGLSAPGQERVREWREARKVGTPGLDDFAEHFNERLGNDIDERTTRMLRQRGKRFVSAAKVRSG